MARHISGKTVRMVSTAVLLVVAAREVGATAYTYTPAAGTTQTVLAVLADDATQTSVTQDGAGTTWLRGANTYTGGTTVNQGILRAGSTQAFGVNSAVSVGSGASLDLNGFNNSIGSLSGSGYVNLYGATLSRP